ncbi:Holliday junction resolvase RecU [Tenuibacillus multivorans]|uniref:Holliday junction resolvase RecU n=1 Tax=Tenuibacillus multivorans TaxID=237069 RepID=A0A1H0CRY1_9BACI|nr:Holliday junction resolvase RecU [Tenuibacillus multivorans]GEL76187.1 Holliday junction resolvase RecU [Tenuibacillus multivorans]SDN60626.1 recombination protein U [Tenuibacillus multivorans]
MKYPKGSRQHQIHNNRPSYKQNTQFGNRGMTLEKEIVETNKYYLETDRAVIHKKPTPIQIVQVDYPKRSAAVIKEAYFQQPSTTDFNGIYKGKYIDFEAKQTNNKTSLPFANIHDHQVEHMKQVDEHGGICFFIIRFKIKNETFLLPIRPFIEVWEKQIEGNRKSIPYSYIKENGYLIPFSLQAKVDYLKIIERAYFNGGDNDESTSQKQKSETTNKEKK